MALCRAHAKGRCERGPSCTRQHIDADGRCLRCRERVPASEVQRHLQRNCVSTHSSNSPRRGSQSERENAAGPVAVSAKRASDPLPSKPRERRRSGALRARPQNGAKSMHALWSAASARELRAFFRKSDSRTSRDGGRGGKNASLQIHQRDFGQVPSAEEKADSTRARRPSRKTSIGCRASQEGNSEEGEDESPASETRRREFEGGKASDAEEAPPQRREEVRQKRVFDNSLREGGNESEERQPPATRHSRNDRRDGGEEAPSTTRPGGGLSREASFNQRRRSSGRRNTRPVEVTIEKLRSTPCRYFTGEECFRGRDCYFRHDGPDGRDVRGPLSSEEANRLLAKANANAKAASAPAAATASQRGRAREAASRERRDFVSSNATSKKQIQDRRNSTAQNAAASRPTPAEMADEEEGLREPRPLRQRPTRFCWHFSRGFCKRGAECGFSHGEVPTRCWTLSLPVATPRVNGVRRKRNKGERRSPKHERPALDKTPKTETEKKEVEASDQSAEAAASRRGSSEEWQSGNGDEDASEDNPRGDSEDTASVEAA